MELKLNRLNLEADISMLLIVPYGIETGPGHAFAPTLVHF